MPGYYRLLRVLSDPTDARHAELAEWVGDDFDPEGFYPEVVNVGLAGIARRRRPAGGRPKRSG